MATDGTTALFLAAQDGSLKSLKYLHSVGGRSNTKTRDGVLPIHGAAQNGHLDCVMYLVRNIEGWWAGECKCEPPPLQPHHCTAGHSLTSLVYVVISTLQGCTWLAVFVIYSQLPLLKADTFRTSSDCPP